jgi:hypothetical protein
MRHGRRRLAEHVPVVAWILQSGGLPAMRPSLHCESVHHATPSPSAPQRVAALLEARGMGSHGCMWGRAVGLVRPFSLERYPCQSQHALYQLPLHVIIE